jgi:hypothetical protein
VPAEPALGVLVVVSVYLAPDAALAGQEVTWAMCSTNGKRPGRSFRVSELEAT